MHLWEVNHPYYCHESSTPTVLWDTWQEFIQDGMGSSDTEYNFLFRWDWQPPLDTDYEGVEWTGDETTRDSLLKLFFVLQRKGIFRCQEVRVCRNDEPAVRTWLEKRLTHLLKVWEPLEKTVRADSLPGFELTTEEMIEELACEEEQKDV